MLFYSIYFNKPHCNAHPFFQFPFYLLFLHKYFLYFISVFFSSTNSSALLFHAIEREPSVVHNSHGNCRRKKKKEVGKNNINNKRSCDKSRKGIRKTKTKSMKNKRKCMFMIFDTWLNVHRSNQKNK